MNMSTRHMADIVWLMVQSIACCASYTQTALHIETKIWCTGTTGIECEIASVPICTCYFLTKVLQMQTSRRCKLLQWRFQCVQLCLNVVIHGLVSTCMRKSESTLDACMMLHDHDLLTTQLTAVHSCSHHEWVEFAASMCCCHDCPHVELSVHLMWVTKNAGASTCKISGA